MTCKRKEFDRRIANQLRIYRRAAGLNQAELGTAVGYRNDNTIARHEGGLATPPLAIAISYEIVFRIPVARLFPELRDEIALRIEARLALLERELGQRSAQGRHAVATARKLMWLTERKNSDMNLADEEFT